jgi:hypothetical protein
MCNQANERQDARGQTTVNLSMPQRVGGFARHLTRGRSMGVRFGITNRGAQAAFTISVAVTVGLTTIWSISAFGLLAGLPIGHWQAVFGMVLTILTVCAMSDTSRERIERSVLVLLLVVLATSIAIATVDDGYDGWLYHEPGVIGLAHGWNPVWQPRFEAWWAAHGADLGNAPGAPFVDGLWTTAYPKANWILGANAVVWRLPLDAGKSAGTLLLFAAAGVAWRSLLLTGLRALPAAVMAAIAALNPVAVMQTTTYYVDGPLASSICLLAFSVLAFTLTGSLLDLLLVACAALLAFNLKFTGPLYVACLLVPSVALWLRRSRLSQRHVPLITGAALLLLVCSVNPYLTNIRIGGSPIQPLNRIYVLKWQMWPEFLNKNRIEKLAISLTFSNAYDPFGDLPDPVARGITTPFEQRSLTEFAQFATSSDLRIGGFGPLFGLILLLTLILWLLPAGAKTDRAPFAAVAAGIILATLLNPEAWWARYAPQLWLLPVLVTAACFRARPGIIALGIVEVMILTSAIAACGRAISAAMTTMQYETALQHAGTGPLFVKPSDRDSFLIPALAYRLHERGTSLRISQSSCTHPMALIVMRVCGS